MNDPSIFGEDFCSRTKTENMESAKITENTESTKITENTEITKITENAEDTKIIENAEVTKDEETSFQIRLSPDIFSAVFCTFFCVTP